VKMRVRDITPDPTEDWGNHLDRGKGFTHHSEDDCDEEYLARIMDKNYTADDKSIQEISPTLVATILRFAGNKCEEFEPHCFTCMAWKVLPSWLENEHPALIQAERIKAKTEEVKLWMSHRLDDSYNSSMYGLDRLAELDTPKGQL
jgi:hypothetical protein